MIKKLHYIKEDYSGNAERLCLESFKKIYPDFEICAWKPGSSPIRILYDNGGLCVGPYILAKKKVPEELFEKPFLSFDNKFETTCISLNLCCSPDKENPMFLEFMERGIVPVLKELGFNNEYKVGLAENDLDLGKIKILNRKEYGFDRGYYELYDSSFLDMNINFNKVNGVHLHYLVINDKINPNILFSIVESYSKMDYKGDKHFLLLVNNSNLNDLISRINVFLLYSCVTEDKMWGIINTGKTKNPEDVITEYIGRKFDNLLSCERI